MSDLKDYRIAEYNALMSKIDQSSRDLHLGEVFFATGIAIFYGWIFKDGASVAADVKYVLLVPTFLALLGFLRIFFRYEHVIAIEKYIRELESEMFSDGRAKGWETRFAEVKVSRSYRPVRQWTWFVVMIATLLIALNASVSPPANAGQPAAEPKVSLVVPAEFAERS